VRPATLAAVSFVSAVVGAALVLALGLTTGRLDGSGERVVVSGIELSPSPPPLERASNLARATFDPARTYAQRSAGVVTIHAGFGSSGEATSQGSGFVVSPEGYVLTNAHVITTAPGSAVEPASELYVEFEDRDRISAEIVGWDVFNDVGLIKVDPAAHELVPVPLGDSAKVGVGEPVSAIGSPFGNQNTLTAGVVSATRRSIDSLIDGYQIVDAIQTDAEINHGNSGGPLFDSIGRAIGINAQIRSTTGLNQGVGFAVPINSAKRSMAQLIASGRVRYGYVGIATNDLTPTIARHFRYRIPYGAVVMCVKPGSPAQRAGLHGGTGRELYNGVSMVREADVIVAIDGLPVRRGDDVIRIVSALSPGEVAGFDVLRGKARRTFEVKLGERSATPSEGC